ncbi:MAG: TATA-box-binding protein [Thermoplasmata archaeon]|nr:MAG: TATA-box-binding protein [Thermoplasmata archaeon]
MPTIEIVNVVASASVGAELDLHKISTAIEELEYDPERFPGAICRVKKPKTAILFFRSGKIVCTGARCLEDVRNVIDTMMARLRDVGVKADAHPDITVQNIVATTDLGVDLKLNAIAISLGLERVEYEPEQFPGLVYRVDEPKVVALLFGSGKLVCTGAKKTEDIEQAVENITEELKGAGFI